LLRRIYLPIDALFNYYVLLLLFFFHIHIHFLEEKELIQHFIGFYKEYQKRAPTIFINQKIETKKLKDFFQKSY